MNLIGIDLGTTNSLVAYWTEKGPEIIPNIHGGHLTPSIISINEDDTLLVGQSAKERLITHPGLTANNFKRYMGTNKKFNLGKYEFSPVDLSSFVLKNLKMDAEAFLGHKVTEAVISVPAYFNNHQRIATKQAAEMAGLTVDRLISEPTAAALAYGIQNMEEETKFMVFDLGGGTFDVSILELFEGIIEVKSVAGDNYLGGEDFTDLLILNFLEHHNLKSISLTDKEKFHLYKGAELCKRNLTTQQRYQLSVILQGSPYEKIYSRTEFDEICQTLLLKFKAPIVRALHDISLTPKDIDSTILIGGATRMPVIRSTVGKMMGNIPSTVINPDEAVALGAVVQAMLKKENVNFKEMILTDVCPFTLGIEVTKEFGNNRLESGHFSPIIERNSPIPISRSDIFYTLDPSQKQVTVKVYQGESRLIKDNVFLGDFTFAVPSDQNIRQSFDTRFTYNINGILEVEATIISTGCKARLVINNSEEVISDEEIQKRINAIAHLKIHPRDKMENKLILSRLERLYEESKGERRQYIDTVIDQLEEGLASQNEKTIQQVRSDITLTLETLEGWYEFE